MSQRSRVIDLYKRVSSPPSSTDENHHTCAHPAKLHRLLPSPNRQLAQIQHLGKEYPGGAEQFRIKCHAAFMRNSAERDAGKIEQLIGRGEFVVKELEALYALRKYRAMKRRYYDDQ